MRATSVLLGIVILGTLLVLAVPGNAQQKLAQTGMKFLNVGTDPRAEGLGEAFTSIEGNSSAMFYNPAGMARLEKFASVMLGSTEWIADIRHNFLSVALAPMEGRYGVIGISMQSVNYGNVYETVRDGDPNGLGYRDLGVFQPTAFMLGVGYARALSEKFSVGGGIKFVSQDLGYAVVDLQGTEAANKTSVVAFDFGIIYRTGFKSLNFGMSVRNFSKEVKYVSEGFQLPLTFKVGVSMNAFDFAPFEHSDHAFLVSIDAEHPRDYPEQFRFGAEYTFMKILSLRIGYVNPSDEYGLEYGVGVREAVAGVGLGVDYSYTPFGIFGNVNRFSLQISLDQF